MNDDRTKNLKEILRNYLQKDGKIKKQVDAARIKRIWFEIMENSIAPYTSDIKFKDGILKIRLTSAALREELSRGKGLIISQLNKRLGEEQIREIIFY
jgi:hypothetical protein